MLFAIGTLCGALLQYQIDSLATRSCKADVSVPVAEAELSASGQILHVTVKVTWSRDSVKLVQSRTRDLALFVGVTATLHSARTYHAHLGRQSNSCPCNIKVDSMVLWGS